MSTGSQTWRKPSTPLSSFTRLSGGLLRDKANQSKHSNSMGG